MKSYDGPQGKNNKLNVPNEIRSELVRKKRKRYTQKNQIKENKIKVILNSPITFVSFHYTKATERGSIAEDQRAQKFLPKKKDHVK